MLRRAACSQRSLSHLRHGLTRHSPRYSYSPRGFTTKYQPVEPKPDITPERRFISIVVAFGVGCSVYFFLDDPTNVPQRKLESVSLSPRQFSPSKLISSEDSGPNSKLIELALPKHFLPPGNADENFTPIWSVYIKDDDIQVERPYTPLNGIDEEGRMRFWIKKYPSGEVGRWLHSKKEGDKIELRGPMATWPWKEEAWDEVVMISGGTGITPFVQLFNTKISKLSSSPNIRFTLVHGSRTPGELPPPELLDSLTGFAQEHPERFRFHVLVDELDGSKTISRIPSPTVGRLTEKSLQQCLHPEQKPSSWWNLFFSKPPPKEDVSGKRIMFLVCGPEPMIGAIAGPYGRNFSQGPVGGILGSLGYKANQVYKL